MQLKKNKRCMQDFSLLENFEEKNCTGAEKQEPRVVIQNLDYFIWRLMWPFLACKLKSDSKLLNLNRIRIRSKSDFGMAEFSSIFFVTFYYQKKNSATVDIRLEWKNGISGKHFRGEKLFYGFCFKFRKEELKWI